MINPNKIFIFSPLSFLTLNIPKQVNTVHSGTKNDLKWVDETTFSFKQAGVQAALKFAQNCN